MIRLFDRTPTTPESAEKRRTSRFACDAIPCSLGQVMDLSISGLKVRCPARAAIEVGDKKCLHIENEGGDLYVNTTVRRIEFISKREVEVGLEFGKVSAAARKALYNVSQNIPTISERGIAGC